MSIQMLGEYRINVISHEEFVAQCLEYGEELGRRGWNGDRWLVLGASIPGSPPGEIVHNDQMCGPGKPRREGTVLADLHTIEGCQATMQHLLLRDHSEPAAHDLELWGAAVSGAQQGYLWRRILELSEKEEA
jgi:hypothetical protein